MSSVLVDPPQSRVSKPSMAKPLPIVYGYLGDSFGKGLGRQGGLTTALSEITPVVMLQRSQDKSAWPTPRRPRVEQAWPNMYVVHDALMLRHSRLGKRLGQPGAWIDGAWLRTALAEVGIHEYVYWITSFDPRMLWGMRTDRLVYDCFDPCFHPDEQESFDRAEFAIARKARVVFASAQTLVDRMKTVNPNVHSLPNACSIDTVESIPLPRPAQLKDRPGPVIGCMSTYDWRVDAAALEAAAIRHSNFTFALVGRVNPDQEQRLHRLRSLPNVLFPGAVSYEEGFAWSAAFDVGLIPFLAGPIGDAVNPVKMYMYLAAGKPVVSTYINECVRHSQWVYPAKTPSDFADAIGRAVSENTPQRAAERIEFAMRNRWQDRAAEAARVLRQYGLWPSE